MFDDVHGQLQIKGVLDEVEQGLARGCLTPHRDKDVEIRDSSICAVACLLVHCLEKHLHVQLEPLLNRQATVGNEPRPKAEESTHNKIEPRLGGNTL
jgi:hypothetical protein